MSAQRGNILLAVMFGVVAILSGIGLLVYFFIYRPSQQVSLTPLPTPNSTSSAITITDFESCVRAGNLIQESYPRRCNANGRSFTEVVDDSPSPASVSGTIEEWKSYSDNVLSLEYPGQFQVYTDQKDISLNSRNTFGDQIAVKYVAFFANQSDEGFTLEFWDNPSNLEVIDWWNKQFTGSHVNRMSELDLKKSDLQTSPITIGSYDLYPINWTGQAQSRLFRYKNFIVLYANTTLEEKSIRILKSLK